MSVEKHVQSAIDALVKAPASEQANIAIGILTRALAEPKVAAIEPDLSDKKKRNAEKVRRYREKKKQLPQASQSVATDKAKG